MVDRPGSSRARRASAVLTTVGVVALGSLLGLGATDPAGAAEPVEEDQTPLKVTIDDLEPGYLPERGSLEVTGTVTNRDDEAWSTINLYAVDGSGVAPMQTPDELQAALELPADAVVGERVTQEGRPDQVDELEPGETSSYRIVVPVSALQVSQGGVYWFGVHALGSSDSVAPDLMADGRARTFLPYVPDRIGAALPTSLVVPLTRPVRYAADGAVTDPEQWARTLAPGGRLHDLVALATADPGDLTWTVDPALLDAVARLARGNPGRSLDPTPARTDPGSEGPTGADGAEVAEQAGTSADGAALASEPIVGDADGDGIPDLPGQGGDDAADGAGNRFDADTVELAGLAQDWLRRTRGVLQAGDVMVLPYGNLDVPAALAHRPALVDLARAQRSPLLQTWGVETTPVTTGPTGAVDLDTVEDAAARDRTGTILLDDDGLGLSRAPAVGLVEGTRVVVGSTGVAEGGPLPGPALTTISLRQRVLAEAAVRVLRSDRQALVAPLPSEWVPDDPQAFFAGLRGVPWLDLDELTPLTTQVAPVVLDADRLPGGSDHESDPASGERAAPLSATTLDGVSTLVTAGETLQNLLADNTRVAGTITQEALTQASYPARDRQAAAQLSTREARDWIDERLDAVQVSAPRGVTLSSESGSFSTTLTNDLDQPVAVRLRVRSDAGVEVTEPGVVRIAPQSRNTVVLDARAADSTVHRIDLEVTDVDRRPLGSSARFPIRYAQVSGVIWLIIGSGVGILLVAVVLRLARRIRRSRRAEPHPVR